MIGSEPADSTPDKKPARPKPRRWILRLLALAFGCVLSLVLLETVFRIYVAVRGWTPNCYLSDQQLKVPHPVNGYQLQPGFNFQSGTTRLTTNSLGLRSDEPTGERPLIAFLGGSAVFGYLVNDNETAAELLERKFEQIGVDIDTQNAGVPGYNLNETIVRFREKIAPLKPDYVVMYLGWNDLPYIMSEHPDNPRFQRGSAPTWLQRLLSHSTLYGFVKSRLFRKSSKLLPPVSASVTPTPAGAEKFRHNLNTLADEVEKSGARLVVCCQMMALHPEVDESLYLNISTDPERRQKMIEVGSWLHGELHNFAASRNAIWVDVWVPPDASLLGDPIHLTQKGEEVVAELWFQTLKDREGFQQK